MILLLTACLVNFRSNWERRLYVSPPKSRFAEKDIVFQDDSRRTCSKRAHQSETVFQSTAYPSKLHCAKIALSTTDSDSVSRGGEVYKRYPCALDPEYMCRFPSLFHKLTADVIGKEEKHDIIGTGTTRRKSISGALKFVSSMFQRMNPERHRFDPKTRNETQEQQSENDEDGSDVEKSFRAHVEIDFAGERGTQVCWR